MCLSFLTDKDRYFTIDLLGEYIYLSIDEQGYIKAREIYDVFFTARGDWQDLHLLCISPHDLISSGELAVQRIPAPGLHAEDRVVYSANMGCRADYDANTNVLSVVVPGVTDRFLPTQEKHDGTVLIPDGAVPRQIAQDTSAVDVMIESGTVFEIALGNVISGESYTFRLEIRPYALLGLPDRTSLRKDPYPEWSQEAFISGPKLCHFNLCNTLEKIQKEQPDAAAGAAIVRGTISNQANPRVPVPLKHHRILLISESPTLVDPRSPIGCVTDVGVHDIARQQVATEWAGGTRPYWMDDIESTAERIYLYLSEYAVAEPKSKEAITAALGTSHVNCALIVNALKHKAVRETSSNLYQAMPLSEEQRKQAFAALATDENLIEEFRWRCYRISYLTVYRYVSRQDSRRLWWRRFKETWAFWLAVIGIVFSLLALILQASQ